MASVVVEVLKNNPGLLGKVLDLLGGLFNRKPKPADVVTTPAGGNTEDDFPDDVIPAPPTKAKVAKVRLKLARVQLNKQRFPDAPNGGLLDPETVRKIQAGDTAMNYGSKFWLDLTAYDEAGLEITRDKVLAAGLQFQTEHHCGDAYIIGKGGSGNEPNAGYETNSTDQIGNGDTAWRSSLGFLHQMKAHGQGEFLCSGKVASVDSNKFTIKVS